MCYLSESFSCVVGLLVHRLAPHNLHLLEWRGRRERRKKGWRGRRKERRKVRKMRKRSRMRHTKVNFKMTTKFKWGRRREEIEGQKSIKRKPIERQ